MCPKCARLVPAAGGPAPILHPWGLPRWIGPAGTRYTRVMKTRVTLVVCLCASLAVGGCLVRKSTHQKALDQITELEKQLADARKRETDHEARIKAIEAELASTKGDLESSSAEASKLRGEKEATQSELDELRRQRDAQEKRLAAYRELQQRLSRLVDAGKLDIGFRNGQMVVKLPSSILFASGSDKLSEAGQAALSEVTAVLVELKDRHFLVAGHTDNVPIKTRQFRNNWVLSTARAVAVLEFMVAQGMPPANVAAAGYGQEDPVKPNDTEEGREANRRIEIILVPNLSELPQLTDDKS